MKKILLALVALIGLSASAQAQSMTNAQSVKIVIPYQMTCSSATVGTTATEMTGNTTTVSTSANKFAIKVKNLSTSATVCCSHSASVSCTDGSANYGDPIAYSAAGGPRNWESWSINTAQPWYCIATANLTPVIVCMPK